MSSQYRNPQEDNNNMNKNNTINNNTALITMPKERRQEEEVDQAHGHTTAVGQQNNRDLITILNSVDFKQLLFLAESFILSRIEFSCRVADKCASDISLVWERLRQKGKEDPDVLKEFESRLEGKVSKMFGQSFSQWVAMGDKHRKQWNSSRIRVLENWNCEPMCVLSAEYYAEDRPLSKQIMKGLADLSQLVSADEGRELLTHEIECRSRGGMRNGKRSYHRNLILSDVTEVINKINLKQLEEVTSPPKKKQRLRSSSPIDRVMNQAFPLSRIDHDPNTPTLSMQETTLCDNELAAESAIESSEDTAALTTLEPKQWLSSDIISTLSPKKKQRLRSPSSIDRIMNQAFPLSRIDHDSNTSTLSMQETILCDNELAVESAIEGSEDTAALTILEPEQWLSSDIISTSPPKKKQRLRSPSSMAFPLSRIDHNSNTSTLSMQETTLCDNELATESTIESSDDTTTLTILEPEQWLSSDIISTLSPKKKQRLRSSSSMAFPLSRIDHDSNRPTLSMQETTLCDNELAAESAIESSGDTTALTTLEPKQWLSSDIIYRVLRACAPTHCYVVDPLFVDPTFKSPLSPRKIRTPMPEDISTVIVPLHHSIQSHWTVVIFERHRTSAQHLDSFPSLKSTIDERHFHQCMKQLYKGYRDKVILPASCPVQPNGYDCGVHVIANTLYDMAKIQAPIAHDCELWRRISRAIISCSVEAVPEDSKPLDKSAYSAELFWKQAQLGSGTIHQALKKAVDALQSERRRNRAEGEEIVGMELLVNNLLTGPGLLAAQRTLVHARESCARQREDLELEHVRWEDAARRWQEKVQAEAKWTRELLADLEEKGMSMSMRG